jgi:poly-gamma-glutamate capsule biosynthesis protein CapA/YwtB (metallophosphatase superfamily)
MAFIGDTYVQRPDPDAIFGPNMHHFREADILFCNLETVVADEQYLPAHDTMRRFPRTDERILASYLNAGINAMNVANNPALYHGRETFVRSLDVLDAHGVVYGGGGRNLTEARRPAIIESNGTKVAFVCRVSVCPIDAGATDDRPGLAYFRIATAYEPRNRHFEVPGSAPIIHTIPNPDDLAALDEDIRAAREQADVVILSWHWGVSPASGGTGSLVGYQVEMAHHGIDMGVDMVIGHHPHVLQPIEVYKGKVIAYSLGNYCHDMDHFGHEEYMAMLLRATVRDGKIVAASFVPGYLRGHGPPDYNPSPDTDRTTEYMQKVSSARGTTLESREGALVIPV